MTQEVIFQVHPTKNGEPHCFPRALARMLEKRTHICLELSSTRKSTNPAGIPVFECPIIRHSLSQQHLSGIARVEY